MTSKFIVKKILSSRRDSTGQTEIPQVLKMRAQHAMLAGIIVEGEAPLADPHLALLGGPSPLAGAGGVHLLVTDAGLQVHAATAPAPQDSTGGPSVPVPGGQ